MSLNPINRARRLVGAIALDPNEDEEPQHWQRQSRVSKLKDALTMYPYLALAGGFFLVALVIFFYPVLPSAHRSGWTLAVGIFAVAVAVSYWKGRTRAFDALSKYDLNILFTGRHIEPRLGVRTGDIDDRLTGFKKLRKFSQGGLRTAFEEFRDRYGRTEITDHKEKYHRAKPDGTGQVRHGLMKTTTFEAETLDYEIDLFNSVSVTHAGEEEDRLDSKDMDTAAVLPPVLDTRTSARVEDAFRAEARARGHADQELSLAKDQLEKLEEYVDPAGQTLFERTKQLVEQQARIKESKSDGQGDSTPDGRGTPPEERR